MKNEIKYALALIGLGMGIIVYAHAMFPSRYEFSDLKTDVRAIKDHLMPPRGP